MLNPLCTLTRPTSHDSLHSDITDIITTHKTIQVTWAWFYTLEMTKDHSNISLSRTVNCMHWQMQITAHYTKQKIFSTKNIRFDVTPQSSFHPNFSLDINDFQLVRCGCLSGCILAPSGVYDWTDHVRRRRGLFMVALCNRADHYICAL